MGHKPITQTISDIILDSQKFQCISELVDKGINIHLNVGNHDLWMKDYLEKECGIQIHHQPIIIKEHNKKIYISHGDDITKNNIPIRIINRIFRNKICQWLFSRIHPDTALKIGHAWSRHSRKSGASPPYLGEGKEDLEQFCINHHVKNTDIHYYIFGHRHLPLDINIAKNCRYISVGDWINHYSYAILEKGEIRLEYFNKDV